ncbi:MAG: hypothetical protein HY717_13685 [Planctomycetes bacterium]|nr:hypothetical protein [Planctomycetota bacterium]
MDITEFDYKELHRLATGGWRLALKILYSSLGGVALSLAPWLGAAGVGHCLGAEPAQPAAIRIDAAHVAHTMAGGLGACWHALGPTIFWYENLLGPGRNNRTCRGSAFGGNPPLSYTKAWDDLLDHARWLGLDFCKVEIDLRMYEPERGKFDWDNDEMQTLYRILDHCQRSGVDVFLTQMWQDVPWNAHQGINRLESAPKSVGDFPPGLGMLLQRLVKDRGYHCIRWLSVANEPGGGWTWWWGPDKKCASIMPAIRAVRAELDRRGLKDVAIAAPDSFNLTMAGCEPEDPAIGAFALHCYGADVPVACFKQVAEKARSRGVPFFVSEFGHIFSKQCEGVAIPFGDFCSGIPKSYPAQMLNAEKVIAGLKAGADGLNRWSFVNRGDLDGQWQLVRTWHPIAWEYYKDVGAESVPYYSFGILTRFTAKRSHILEVQGDSEGLPAAALRSPKGNLTIIVLNKAEDERKVSLSLIGMRAGCTLYKYQVTEPAVSRPDYRMEPREALAISLDRMEIGESLPAQSITVYSTYKLAHADAGIIAEE